jgi:ABC-2 type transport system permease protein
MVEDILTVIYKEYKGLFRFRGSRLRFLLVLLTPVLFATVMPLQVGTDWVKSPLPVLIAAVIPIIVVGTTIPDSFAGERERHTLETLLASRLPDRAILFGKLAVTIALSLGMTTIVLLAGLATINIAHWSGHLLLYTPLVGLGSLGLSVSMSLLIAGTGVLISTRAATVQEASQILMAIFMIPFVALQMVALLLRDLLTKLLRGLDGRQLLFVILAAVTALAIGMVSVAIIRFRRSRLVG